MVERKRSWPCFNWAIAGALIIFGALAPVSHPARALDLAGGGMPYAVLEHLPSEVFENGGAKIRVHFGPGEFKLSRAEIVAWLARSAEAVSRYYGRFPVRRLRILIAAVPGRKVRTGQAYGHEGAAVRLLLGTQADARALERDWIAVHEMVHLALPDVGRRRRWLSEGLATYVESIARAQVGHLSQRFIWGGYRRMMHHGLPAAGDRGLDNTPSWGRTYWGGALFCLVADVEIRRETGGAKGLQDALRGIVDAGGSLEVEWPVTKVLAAGDTATGTQVLSKLYERWRNQPVAPDLDELWAKLGVRLQGGRVHLDENASLAHIRRQISAPR